MSKTRLVATPFTHAPKGVKGGPYWAKAGASSPGKRSGETVLLRRWTTRGQTGA